MPRSATDAARLENAPKPPAFLDPLYRVEDCYYYSVPRFYETTHPMTNWLLNRIVGNDVESLKRKLEVSPNQLKNRYFQVLDDPQVYTGNRMSGPPMFHTKCLLYLTPLGMCLYFKSLDAASLILSFRTTSNDAVAHPDEPQFASHLQDTSAGDFHAFTPFIVMMRRQFFDASVPLQLSGWRPEKPFVMPLRRRYERRLMYCRDWLDAALGLLACRPVYPLAALVLCVSAHTTYGFSRLPMAAVKPLEAPLRHAKKPKPRAAAAAGGAAPTQKKGAADPWDDPDRYVRYGIMPVGDQPLDLPLVGTRNLMELCEVYNRSQQIRLNNGEIRSLLRQARADGVNTNILLMQAEENIAPDPKPSSESNANNATPGDRGTERASRQQQLAQQQPQLGQRQRRLMWKLNCNNHAKKEKKQPPQKLEERQHCSEPLRILLFTLTKDKSGTSLQQCLDAVGAYVRRYYFNCAQELPAEHGRSRDTRNIVVSLLNLISREQLAMDTIVGRIRNGHPRWRALEMNKQQHTNTIAKISSLMTSILISSKQIVSFLAAKSFPPYPERFVDFAVDNRLATLLTSIQYGVVRDLNGCKDSWKYLTHDMLGQVVRNSAVLLHFKFGKRPTKAEIDAYGELLDRKLKVNKDKN